MKLKQAERGRLMRDAAAALRKGHTSEAETAEVGGGGDPRVRAYGKFGMLRARYAATPHPCK